MPASKHSKQLSVLLPESEVLRFKSVAARRGVSFQEAIYQALTAWASEVSNGSPEPLDALQGSLAHVDTGILMRQEKETELSKDRRWYR